MRIDLHVHLVGNGASGSGCWYRPQGWTRLGAPFMLRGFGLSPAALRQDLDTLYAERLLSFVRSSSLDRVVILARNQACFDFVPLDAVLLVDGVGLAD